MTKLIKIITLSVVVSIIFSSLASYLIINKNKVNYLPQTKTKQELIKEFYDVETAVHVSPHGIRKGIAAGDDSFILVDLRSQEEYENCLLYTSDAADDLLCVDLGGRRIIKKKKK